MSHMPAGSYIEGASVLHKMDAFIKLLCTLLLLTAVILSNTPAGYALVIAGIATAVKLSAVGVRNALSGVKHTWLFLAVVFLMNALFFEPEQPLWQWWILRLSAEGIVQGAHVVLRVALAMILGNLLVSTTSPLELTGAIETFIFPLTCIGVPIRDVAMILGAAIQFVPTFLEETALIRKAQTARGARFESRKLTEKAQSVLPLVVPIFVSAFRRADELSVAMEARGYRRTKRKTPRPKRSLHRADLGALCAVCLLCAAEIFI